MRPKPLGEGGWLGRKDSNLRMAGSKPAALPLGYAPKKTTRDFIICSKPIVKCAIAILSGLF